MKLHRFLFSLFLMCPFAMWAQLVVDTVAVDTTPVQRERLPMLAAIDSLLDDEAFESTQLGLLIYDLAADTIVFERGKRQLLHPASVEKVLTCASVIDKLGPDHLLRTRLYAHGQIADSTFTGDIYLRGGFDPLFGAEDMEAFVDEIASRGVKNIDGRILADVSFKDTLRWGAGWCWDDDEKTLTPLQYRARGGFIPAFLKTLTDRGITCPDSITRGLLVDVDTIELWCERTHTLDDIMYPCLKRSDNNYAEALFYQLGAAEGLLYPSASISARSVEALESKIGLNPDHYNVADGSGLSRYNLVTAELIVTLLRYIWATPEQKALILPSLPIAGLDGTLERRMRFTWADERIRAKTGTLSGVSTLAGYAETYDGRTLAFCILNQGFRRSAWAHHFQDALCEVMCRP